jgi:hypothetical protein
VNEDEALNALGIDGKPSQEEVSAAFKRLAPSRHPDQGGSDALMAELTAARDVALEAARQRALPTIADIRDLVELQGRALQRSDERREKAVQVENLKRTLIRRHTSELDRRKRMSQVAAGLAAIVAAVTGLLKGLQTPPFDATSADLVIAVFAIAAHKLGFDPSIGILHTDQRYRRSLASDLMEPARPVADRMVLDLLSRRELTRGDAVETREGVCRLGPKRHMRNDWLEHLSSIPTTQRR